MLHRTSLLLLLLLLLWAGVAASVEVELDKRIYNGVPCARPYHVRLLEPIPNANPLDICGGSLISPQWVITAGHCKTADMLAIVSDAPNVAPQAENVRRKKVKRKHFVHHDLMLLELENPINNINPVNPPDCNNKPNRVQVAGHAATYARRDGKKACDFTPDLHCADMDIADCGTHPLILNCIQTEYKHSFCYREPGMDTCPGDSGGGVVHNNMIYGVHVEGGEYVCAVRARAKDLCDPEYAKWITETTGIAWPV